MTPDDCKKWIQNISASVETTHPSCYIDRVVYWYLNNSHCELIKRDKEWFKNSIPKLQKMWNRVCFLRESVELKELFLSYHDYYKPECNGYINEYKFPKLIEQRDNYIFDVIYNLKLAEPSRKILILSDRIDHLKKMNQKFQDTFEGDTGFYIGGMKEKDLKITESK
jgi:hypothetical protein